MTLDGSTEPERVYVPEWMRNRSDNDEAMQEAGDVQKFSIRTTSHKLMAALTANPLLPTGARIDAEGVSFQINLAPITEQSLRMLNDERPDWENFIGLLDPEDHYWAEKLPPRSTRTAVTKSEIPSLDTSPRAPTTSRYRTQLHILSSLNCWNDRGDVT